MVNQGIIAKEGEIGHITPRFTIGGYGLGPSQNPLRGDPIHLRRLGRFQRGLSIQGLLGVIPHPVAH